MYKIILILSVLFCSCMDTKKDIPNMEITANIDFKGNHAQSLGELLDTCFFTALETTEESVIGTIDKIIIENGMIFILDKEQGKGVYIFNTNGKFLKKISPLGKGPGEFVSPGDFFINTKDKLIGVNDIENRKVLFFDYQGRFTKSVILPFPSFNVEQLSDSTLVFIGSGFESNLIISSMSGKPIKRFFPYNETNSIALSKHFAIYNNKVLYQQTGNDTIFVIADNQPEPFRYFKILDEEKDKPDEFFSMLIPKQISLYSETDDHIYFKYKYQDVPHYVIYSKQSNSYKVYTNKISDNILYYPYPPQILTTSGSFFVGVLQPALLMKNSKTYSEIIKDSISPLSNPIIGYYKFKKF